MTGSEALFTGPFTEQSKYHTDTIPTGLYPEQAQVTECEHLSPVPKLTGAMEQTAEVCGPAALGRQTGRVSLGPLPQH